MGELGKKGTIAWVILGLFYIILKWFDPGLGVLTSGYMMEMGHGLWGLDQVM